MTYAVYILGFAVVFLFHRTIVMHGYIIDYKHTAMIQRDRARMMEGAVQAHEIKIAELRTQVEMMKSGAPYR